MTTNPPGTPSTPPVAPPPPRPQSLADRARRLRDLLKDVWNRNRLRRIGVIGTPPGIVAKFPTIFLRGELHCGKKCAVWSTNRDQTVFYIPRGGKIVLGDSVFINQGAVMCAEPGHAIVIGDHVLIGNNAWLATSDYHQVAPDKPVKAGSIHLKRNTWIGQGALILPGVTIGEHSVVAARSIVTKDVPPRSIVAGTPAKIIGTIDCPDDWVRH